MMLLGIDYGKRNIGLAFGSENFTRPLKVIDGKNWDMAIAEIIKLSLENRISKIVIGLPLDTRGKKMKIVPEIERFSRLLGSKSKIEVETFDETATTREALISSIESGLSRKSREKLDAIAAAIMLKHYTEGRKGQKTNSKSN